VTLHGWLQKVLIVYATLRAVTPIASREQTASQEDPLPGNGSEMTKSSWSKPSPIRQRETTPVSPIRQRETTPVMEIAAPRGVAQLGIFEHDEENPPHPVDLTSTDAHDEGSEKRHPKRAELMQSSQEQQSFFQSVQQHHSYITLRTILSPFTYYDLIDLLTIVAMVLTIIFRIQCIFKSLLIHDILVGLDIEVGDYDSELENIVHLLLGLGSLEIIYVNLIALTVSILLIQFFRYISFDERLAMISLTIYQSLSLLIPVLLVFVVVLASYAMIGQAMYGKMLIEFSTINNALNTLFLFVLGDTTTYYLSKS
jgi:hypothetical protein